MLDKLKEIGLFKWNTSLNRKSDEKVINKLLNRNFLPLGALALSAIIPATSAFAGTQSLIKDLISSPTADIGEEVEYRFSFQCSGITSDCGELSITDDLPAGMTLVSCTGAPPIFTLDCPEGGTSLGITKGFAGDPNGSYSDGNTAVLVVKAIIGLDVLPGTDLINTASSTITNPDQPANADISSTAGTVTVGNPTPNWSLNKNRTSPSPSLNPTWDTDVSYRVELCSNSAIGNINLSNVHLVDVYPAGASIVNNGGASTATANTLDWDLGNIDIETLYGANSYSTEQCITRNYTLSYPLGSFPDGTQLLNTLSVTTDTDVSAGPIGDAVIDENIGVPTPGASLSKSANDVLPGEDLRWRISANIDDSNAPVPDLVIYEEVPTAPVGLTAKRITSGQWNSPLTTGGNSVVEAQISYATDSAGDCSNATYVAGNLSGGYIPSPASVITYNNPSLPTNTTCIRWEFRDTGPDGGLGDRYIPRGWRFTTNPIFIQDTIGFGGPFPTTVTNCAGATFTNFGGSTESAQGCGSANIENATSEVIFQKTATGGSLKPGDTKVFTLRFRHDRGDSTGSIVNPVIADLLPPEFEFVSWDDVTGLTGIGGPYPEPNLEVVDDFSAPGITLLRYSWANAAAPAGSIQLDGTPAPGNNDNNTASFVERADIRIIYTARLKPYTVPGTYTNNAAFFDNAPLSTCNGSTAAANDVGDLDGDSNTAEQPCEASYDTDVISVSVLDGQKWVKGDFPTLSNVDDPTTNPVVIAADCPNLGDDLGAAYVGYTRFPCAAQAQHEGDFEYILRSQSIGNEPLTNYVIYDVLPFAGDTGVSELLNEIDRGSVWKPQLKSAVVPVVGSFSETAMGYPGSVIEYTTDANPCRPEVAAGSSDADWVAGCPAGGDWTFAPVTPAEFATVTAFRIKIPFAAPNTWTASPASEMLFKVTMTAPVGSPPSIVDDATYFNPAWNTIAHRAFSSGGTRLLAAEPRKVGIVLPPKYRIGNLVWLDTNQDGNADAAGTEPGLVGVNVQLWLDDDGTAGPSAGDTHFTALDTATDGNGHYSFEQLDAGDYYVVIPNDSTQPPLAGLASSSTGEEASPNADVDNNDNGVTILAVAGGPAGLASGIITVGPVTTLEPTNEVSRLGSGTDDDNDGFPDPLSNYSVDFGFVPAVTIGSLVWNDTNNNGFQDNGELGIPGATVTLLDAGGIPVVGVAPQVTLADGLYFFEGLAEGNYSVRVTPPVGYVKSTTQTTTDNDDTTNDSNIATTVGTVHTSGEFTLEVDGEPPAANEGTGLLGTDNADNADDNNGNMTVDFGFYFSDPNAVSLGSVVWSDTNNNGVQDTSELGIPGAIVTLLDGTGAVVSGYAPITTSADGLYYFGNLPEGDYQVQVEIPAGFTPSTIQETDANTDLDNDSNVDITASVGDIHKSGTITLNNDGEPLGVNEDGTLGGDDQDSTDDNNGNMTADFGFYPTIADAVSIGSLVWEDTNDNGKQDASEAPIAGAVVTLLDSAGIAVAGITTQTTGVDGLYYFDNLPEGDYSISVTPPVGYEPSSAQNATDNDDTDNDSNIASTVGTTSTSGLFTLSNDGEPGETGGLIASDDADATDDDNGNMTVDFGFKLPVTNAVSIGSVVWNDINFDGVQDLGEPGISGATVTLLDSNGVAVPGIAAQTTGPDGLYFFGNLPEGSYQVRVTPPAGLVPTFVQESNADGDADNDSNIATALDGDFTSGVVTLSNAGEPTESTGLLGSDDADNAAETNGNMTVDFGFVPTTALGGIQGNVSQDKNNDGEIDFIIDPTVDPAIDMPIEGVVLQLLDAAGQPVLDSVTGEPLTTTTDENGNYSFLNLIPADYQVFQIHPNGFISVSDVDGDDQNDTIGDGTPISVTAGAIAAANNFIERLNPAAIPTLSEWALMMLMMLLGFVGYRQGLARKI